MTPLPLATALALVVAEAISAPVHADAPTADAAEPAFDFGTVAQGATVEHAFAIRNTGAAPLRIERVVLTPPLVVRRMPARVAPGERALVAIQLPTASLQGSFRGDVAVSTNDPARPELELTLIARVVAPVEVVPMRAVFVSGTRAEPGTSSVEIVNHENEPIRIESVEHPAGTLTVRLDELEQGRRWRLVVSLLPGAPAGRRDERIVVRTTSRAAPAIAVLVHAYLRERVYTFPDAVDLGAIPLSAVKRGGSSPGLAQTLMVYQVGGTDFRARLEADLPSLRLRSERGPKADRYQTTVTLAPDGLAPGPIRGTIVVETNDPDFPRLAVPVTGTILGG